MLKFQLESSARLPFEQNYYIAAENRIGNSTENYDLLVCSKGKNGRNREKRIS